MSNIELIQGDCLDKMKCIRDESVDLVLTSPPYNKGWWSANRNLNNGLGTKSRRIEYGTFNDCMEPCKYEEWQSNVITEAIRILKPSGSILYNTIDILNEHQTYHPVWLYKFPVKQIIIWNRKSTPKIDKSYFFPTTEYIFWIQKSREARTFFDRKKALFSGNVWTISPDAKNPSPAPFPVSLAENGILTCCPDGGVVLDPFMGSGTTGVACKNLNRDFIGIELDRRCFEVAERRIKEDTHG